MSSGPHKNVFNFFYQPVYCSSTSAGSNFVTSSCFFGRISVLESRGPRNRITGSGCSNFRKSCTDSARRCCLLFDESQFCCCCCTTATLSHCCGLGRLKFELCGVTDRLLPPGVTAVVAAVLSESVEYQRMAVDDRFPSVNGIMLLAQSGL